MIVVCEPVRHGLEHQAVNSSMLNGLLEVLTGEQVHFIADPSHLATLLPDISETNATRLHTSAVSLPPRHAPPHRRFLDDVRMARYTLRLAREHAARAVIFFSVTQTLLFALSMLNTAAPRPTLFGIMHGGLAELAPRRGRLARFVPRGLRLAMSLATRRELRFVVLEEAIRSQLHRIAPRIAEKTLVLPHPLPADVLPIAADPHEPPTRVGLLGLATPQKGLFKFAECARRFAQTQPGQIEFHCIGRVHADAREQVTSFLEYFRTQPARAPLERARYRELLESMDYACFFFAGGHYDLTASGALLDCIAAGLPIIGRRNALLVSIESRFGPIGVLYDHDEPDEAVRKAVELRSTPSYRTFRHNLLAAASQRTTLATGARFSSFLSATLPGS
jgi:hypothetical protein